MDKLCVYSFYRFKEIKNKKKLHNTLLKFLGKKLLKGTILIADEGINGSIAGKESDLFNVMGLIRKEMRIRKLDIKVNKVNFFPFNKMRVKIKNEIVSFGQKNLKITKSKSNLASPSEWNKIILDKNVILIDVRNDFEVNIGKFKRAVNPKTKNFREFSHNIDKLNINKSKKIAMYCTGGIRCEKASLYLNFKGYKNVVQLEGGILNYLDYKIKSGTKNMWTGECFVFDNRVSVDKKLNKGKFIQCFGCRHPLTKKDTYSAHYKKGISCPNCYNRRTEKQFNRSRSRQRQIELFENRKIQHTFKRIVY